MLWILEYLFFQFFNIFNYFNVLERLTIKIILKIKQKIHLKCTSEHTFFLLFQAPNCLGSALLLRKF